MNLSIRLVGLQIRMQWMFAIILFGACGCGGGGAGRPDLVPVTGTVMYNGKPIAGASVSFWKEGAPRPAAGITDSDGKFSLSMFDPNDGAMVGENVITVSKAAAVAPTSSDDMSAMLNDPTKRTMMMEKQNDKNKTKEDVKPEVPVKYGDRKTTPLKETVAASGNEFLLQLAE